MSLSMLVGGGSECGPTNPLQGLVKRFDQDHGPQQLPTSELQQDAARFFSTSPSSSTGAEGLLINPTEPRHLQQQPFDMNQLQETLPQFAPVSGSNAAVQSPFTALGSAGWANDFLRSNYHQQNVQDQGQAQGKAGGETVQERVQSPPSAAPTRAWGSSYAYRMGQMSNLAMSTHGPAQIQGLRPEIQNDRELYYSPYVRSVADRHLDSDRMIEMLWDREFQSQESVLDRSALVSERARKQEESQLHQDQEPAVLASAPPADAMARLAAQVIQAVAHEQNHKFKESSFMNLMRQFRDGEVVVDQNGIVPSESVSTLAATGTPGVSLLQNPITDLKGKGKARATDVVQTTPKEEHISPLALSMREKEGDVNEAYFEKENEEFKAWWDAHHAGPSSSTTSSVEPPTVTTGPSMSLAQQKQREIGQWYEMQNAWDEFEATTTGVRPVLEYEFEKENPYLKGVGGIQASRHHSMHTESVGRMHESILELEAAIQQDPYKAQLWYELGVRQQSSEREVKAVQALRRCLALDASYLPAWLALAVSYTNESNRTGTYDAVREWALRHPEPKYQEIIRTKGEEVLENGSSKNFYRLVNVLIEMARASSETQQVDADVQIALAVLLNTLEDYPRALDCFLTALAVRPDDWLLYNRVGATMANNARAGDALQYYYRALELNPGYIRARYNLGISCINLHRYEEALTHILDALVLQDSEGSDATGEMGSGGLNKRGVTSSTLWDSLKTACLHLQRVDLASFCDHRDLDGFRNTFNTYM
ncbi:hypothetical protein ID866_1413 [Astraeus odoratus]|nr:hypothetical protein ID866_1413 [Astraeus odoratus]